MKRDNDLIRMILRAVEKQATGDQVVTLTPDYFRPMFPDLSENTLDEHIRLLVEVGFLKAEPHQLGWFITRLTWNGHDFLANANHETAWQKTKKVAGDLSFDIFKETLKANILALTTAVTGG